MVKNEKEQQVRNLTSEPSELSACQMLSGRLHQRCFGCFSGIWPQNCVCVCVCVRVCVYVCVCVHMDIFTKATNAFLTIIIYEERPQTMCRYMY